MAEKTVAQKLFLKGDVAVLFINPPHNLNDLLGGLPAGIQVQSQGEGAADWILAFIANRRELEAHLPALKARLKPRGLLWIAYHKGTSKIKTDIHRDSINAYATSLGLVGVAMISIDDDWSALRLKLGE